MKPGPTLASLRFQERIRLSDPPKTALDWLVDICIECNWASSSGDAREKAEAWVDQFLRLLRNEYNGLTNLGRVVRFEFNTSSEYLLQGASFEQPNDPPDVVEAKKRRLGYEQYSDALAGLSPRQFEGLCAILLKMLGVRDPVLTAYSSDQGIDFFGRLELAEHLSVSKSHQTLERQLQVWLVGQAKHYPAGAIGTVHIREIVGTVELARAHTFSSSKNMYESLKIRVCDPVYYLIFTTGRLSADAWRLISRSGVIAMDGTMIGAFLADRTRAGNATGDAVTQLIAEIDSELQKHN